MKVFLRIFAFFFSLWFIGRFCTQHTDGFAREKIRSSLAYNPKLSQVISEDLYTSLKKILDQPFYYLGAGTQTFSFRSLDNQYVIKFYRHDRRRHYLSPIIAFLPKIFRDRLLKTIKKRQLKLLKDFTSFELAFSLLRKETGLIYLRLDKADDFPLSVSLYDKISVYHKVFLNDYEFILQKKALPFYPTLKKWIDGNSYIEAKEALGNLIHLLAKRCQYGLFDKDPNLQSNFGFIENTAVQFDIGRFSKDPSRKDPAIYLQDVKRILHPLKEWLRKQAPELENYIDYEMENLQIQC